MVWPAVIAAAGALAGGGIASAGQARANREARSNIGIQAAHQRALRMTAYQDTMNDMRSAGLNPILAYQKGATAAPGVGMPNVGNVGAGIGQGVASAPAAAMEALRVNDLRKNVQQDTKKKVEETYATATLGARNREQNKLIRKQQKLTDQQIRMMVRQYNILGADEASARAVESLYRKYPELRKWELFRRSVIGGSGPSLRRKGK